MIKKILNKLTPKVVTYEIGQSEPHKKRETNQHTNLTPIIKQGINCMRLKY
jgi:hypothetical protein